MHSAVSRPICHHSGEVNSWSVPALAGLLDFGSIMADGKDADLVKVSKLQPETTEFNDEGVRAPKYQALDTGDEVKSYMNPGTVRNRVISSTDV